MQFDASSGVSVGAAAAKAGGRTLRRRVRQATLRRTVDAEEEGEAGANERAAPASVHRVSWHAETSEHTVT